MSKPASARGQFSLGAFLHPSGHHVAAWRHPDALPDGGVNIENYTRLARLAEAAKFDLVFLADTAGVSDRNLAYISRTTRASLFEPLTLLSALSAVTETIGLIATVSTSFNEPFNMARYFASLDQISGGRSGWNLVTSGSDLEAANFSLPAHYRHAERYRRAGEFADVVKGLWDSWDDDAFLFDKENGVYSDPAKLHALNHRGEHFAVRGPLGVPRSPQGQPVLVQAGSSADGRDLAARTAEVIFTAQQTLAEAQEFYGDVKERLRSFGRAPEDLKILPGVFPVVGRSEDEAREKFELLQSLVHPVVGLAYIAQHLGGADLSGYPLDGPVPDVLPETNGGKSRQQLLLDLARRENLTIRQLYLRIAGARGHWQLVGTPKQIADELEERFVSFGADGFNVMPPSPTGLDDFVELVLPELRRRGLFRHEYAGRTLRDHLGLRRPASRYATPVVQAAE
ncbi:MULTISPECIES: LLM class flavin-dependent oxidoreductase [unclassified Chelatococcus]|uniref:LLM class flavin-dependent oxidoreductase n=1 Tax=unclassified Chelatococcus TaxID=2638111 RepID=UPI001BCF9E9F|nr:MULTISPECIES: LLM class flavin-dependent oxidoreductase [unclassified Chelatococcus]CAH1650214.1 N-acetyl-S-(2-succino)cysteine monooxygenase [Hyphomicrobiales bacterium]MBS7743336.1 LLM class flavin-dependent oxidoreductase [Chelatococcus sp. HY11]MBX3541546.1 LLM class flavin-dependent oxidoreductase [Chelatococcus sp.]MCO5074562.1 LLM class flavin-dependent oxidoreductase [Chelatococcus sp.]CAH1692503.1 N-acetyl-S-(2-succino)cysteine monooxygenase [Hyphomicrobiales bacterium]